MENRPLDWSRGIVLSLSPEQAVLIESFREWTEHAVDALSLFGPSHRHDREDASTLATRWVMERDIWLEIAVRPFLPQIRVGVVTTDRWKSEDLEQLIEDSGDTMQEFVELGFDTVDLDWHDPPVEHYRHEGQFFYFATPFDIRSLDTLADDATRTRTLKMLRGYHCAFTGRATG